MLKGREMTEPATKTLVVAHVFYPRFWNEMAQAIRVIGTNADLIVTSADEAAVESARRDFPRATFLVCENRGYDVWPFLKALQSADLNRYGRVVKLHTKRNVEKELWMNHTLYSGSAWRNYLLSFVRTPAAWRRTCRLLGRSSVGMVADRRTIFEYKEGGATYAASFDRARTEVEAIAGGSFSFENRFVGGTMFAARIEPMRLLARRGFTAEMFEPSTGHDQETYAHVVERMLGLAVYATGRRIVAWNGSVRLRRLYYAQTALGKTLRFLYRTKRDFESQTAITSVLHIPIRRRPLKEKPA